ncbi:MAG TPA: DPP IV N-terminal domain-containing protein [Thermoanaerobaculia bacterium]|nr:DPP IV N-terminal domain-containing protein [Thermoanaerobaculia bacterium]
MRSLLLTCCLTALATAAAGQTAKKLTVDDLFHPAVNGRQPTQPAWSPDGRLSYVWDEKGDGKERALWILDPATGKSELLARLSDLGRLAGQEEELGLGEYSWSPRGDALLLVSEDDLYLYSPASRKLSRLTETEAEEENPQFSPDGSKVAFIRDFDLHLIDLATGREAELTTGGQENEILNGITDWVYWEEIWGRDATGFWWSPDSSRIAYYRFEEEPVGVYPLVDNSPAYPKVRWQKYPKAGTDNPRVKVGVLDLATKATTWMATGDPESYLARVDWAPSGDAVAIQRLNREQTRIDLLRCRPADGSCAPLAEDTWPTWVNLGQDFRFLPDGRFLWGSERSGWRRLYLHGTDGKVLRPVTPEGWAIASLDGVSEKGDWAVVNAFRTEGLGPIDRHVARVHLDGEGWEVLTTEPGTHIAAGVSERTGAWIHGWNDADTPFRTEVRKADGGTVPLPSAPSPLDFASLPKWEFLTIPGPDGSRLPARLLKPEGFDPSRRYPVIVYHYGGPGSQVVANGWNLRGLWPKMMAQRGFVSLSVDNQSSVFFGKKGEDRDHRRFGEVNLAGQLAGVDYLKTLPWVDSSRIGLWGWSGGGTNTLYCLLNRPGVWKAGVAGAPVTDWRLYDSIWTERYLDHPKDNEEGYRLSSPITHAANLKDRLLLIHGLADDNVHPQNTVVMSDALIKAGIPFEEAFYPGQNHGMRGPAIRHFYGKMTNFFERELLAVEVEDVEIRRE